MIDLFKLKSGVMLDESLVNSLMFYAQKEASYSDLNSGEVFFRFQHLGVNYFANFYNSEGRNEFKVLIYPDLKVKLRCEYLIGSAFIRATDLFTYFTFK